MSQPAMAPIILTAFSLSEAAIATNRVIENVIRNHYPDRPLFWAYNQRTVTRARQNGRNDILLPHEILRNLAENNHSVAIMQSLHLLPGFEFHELQKEVRCCQGLDCRIGLPLFSSPSDYHLLLDLLAPTIMQNRDCAVLVIGHGTRHPVWTAYLALESMLRQRFGERLFVGVLEHYPKTDQVVHTIAEKGYRQVLLIPFFLSYGLHVERDMLGDNSHSLKNTLENHGIEIDVMHHGIGMIPGIGELVVRHIDEADNRAQHNHDA